jgi:hypothetical protein
MTEYPPFGAGLWHFASYVDRYATDGYAPAVSTLEMIERAAEVGELSAVDVPYPLRPGWVSRKCAMPCVPTGCS